MVVARVGADADSQRSARGKGEHKVQEVQAQQNERPRQGLDEVRKDTVERVGRNAVRGCEQAKVHTRRVPHPGVDQRRRERQADHQKHKVQNTHEIVCNSQH